MCFVRITVIYTQDQDHAYYRSQVVTNSGCWIDERIMLAASEHDSLSDSYRTAVVSDLI